MTKPPKVMKPTDPRVPKGYNWMMEHVGFSGEDCLLWPFSVNSSGYGQFSFREKMTLAHRFMCLQINGPPEYAGLDAAHSCGNRRCVSPKHISWKTKSLNQHDRKIHGTSHAGKRASKLTAQQAKIILSLKGIESPIKTAAVFGVTESNIRLIQTRKTWKHLSVPDCA